MLAPPLPLPCQPHRGLAVAANVQTFLCLRVGSNLWYATTKAAIIVLWSVLIYAGVVGGGVAGGGVVVWSVLVWPVLVWSALVWSVLLRPVLPHCTLTVRCCFFARLGPGRRGYSGSSPVPIRPWRRIPPGQWRWRVGGGAWGSVSAPGFRFRIPGSTR